MRRTSFDLVVVGAGTAGANAAYQFARRGRSVLLVERRSADAGGAQWVNGVLERHFHEAGLEPPSGPERVRSGNRVHMRGSDPSVRATLERDPTVAADMALLGRRLRGLAAGAGVEIVDRAETVDVRVDEATGRLRAIAIRTADDPTPATVDAALFVDASGHRGALRRHVPDLRPWCPPARGNELCSASDAHHRITDPDGARAFLARHGAELGDTLTFLGVSGGFSICGITIAEDLAHVGILVGCLANGRYGTGPRMVAELREREPWIGEPESVGNGVIPLRRPYARFTAPGVALVGDAACQVFPAHGSGIGLGLVAGSMLAEGVASAADPGDPDVLWEGYQAPFQHRHGRDLLAFDVLRRASTRFGADGAEEAVRAGLIDEGTIRTGLEQRWQPPPPAESVRAIGRMVRHPRVGRVLAPAVVRAQALRLHGLRYPARRDLAALARWDRRTEGLLGPLPS